MIPSSLVGSYKRYKEDTSIFITWLVQASSICGYQFQDTIKQTSGHNISTGEQKTTNNLVPVATLLLQAEAIVDSKNPGIQLPPSIERAAQRAIDARKRFSAKLQSFVYNEESDESHAHFIGVLEKTLSILKLGRDGIDATKPGSTPDISVDTLSNIYEHLHLEDIETSEEVVASFDQATSKEATSKKPRQIYELHYTLFQLEIETILRILCFFEDLHRIEEHICGLWKAYKEAKLDWRVAAMTTNAAISLVEHEENELAEAVSVSASQTYLSFAWILLGRVQKGGKYGIGEYLEDVETPFTPLGRHIFSGSCGSLLRIFITRGAQSETKFHPLDYPMIPTLRTRYESQHKLHLLESQSHREREEDYTYLVQLISDLCPHLHFIGKSVKAGAPRLAIVDEFANSIESFLNMDPHFIRTKTVFASHLVVDIHRILGDKTSEALKMTQALADNCYDLMKHSLSTAPRGSGPYWNESDGLFSLQMVDFRNFISHWQTSQNPFRTAAQGTPGEHMIAPAKDRNFVFSGNPLYCGTFAFNLTLVAEEAGILLANHHLSCLFTAQLYDSWERNSLLTGKWPAMEDFIKAHLGPIFFGSRPKDPKEAHVRFALRVGLPLQELAGKSRDKRAKNPKTPVYSGGSAGSHHSSRLKPQCLIASKPSQMLSKYFKSEEPMVRCLYALDAEIAKGERKNKTVGEHYSLDVMRFLERLPAFLGDSMSTITIDYITLTRHCNALLNFILDSKQIKFDQMVSDQMRRDESSMAGKWAARSAAKLSNSNNTKFVHLTQQILWQDKEWMVDNENLPKGWHIENFGQDLDVVKSGKLAQKWLSREGLLVR